jgi:type II secretory pathway component PulF
MGWLDWFRYLVPWCRKRLQRDFSYMLALLLDSGIPEAKALELAAESTANGVIKQRAQKAIAAVRSGAGMAKAVQLMDNSKEFQWRLTNALQTEFNFVDALAGWHESLSARADRQQQTYATLMQTSVLFFLGLIVGSIMVGMFLPLIVMMEKLAW